MVEGGESLPYTFAVDGWPMTYIFDKKGKFKWFNNSIRGEGDQKLLEYKIQELL